MTGNGPLYCPTRTIRWRTVLGSCLGRGKVPDWPQFQGTQAIPLYQGRAGLWILCELWGVRPGDEVLMPAYNCGTEVDPFHAYGARVVFYRVDEEARIDYDDLKRRCSSATRIVYVTHYFGWPHPVTSIYRWCRERGIKVVEDCALSLFSIGEEGPLGTLADASLFSFKKTLSVPDGAVLALHDKSEPFPQEDLRGPPWGVTVRALRPFVKSTLLQAASRAGVYSRLQKRRMNSFDLPGAVKSVRPERPEMPPSYYFDRRVRDWTMSAVTAGILSRVDASQTVDRRRRNYLFLLERVRASVPQARPLFQNLPEGVCPLGLVLLVPHRSVVVRTLNACGVAAFPWWEGYHRDFDWNEFSESRYLKDHALLLPISQTMDERHMVYIGECLERVGGLLGDEQEPLCRQVAEHE